MKKLRASDRRSFSARKDERARVSRSWFDKYFLSEPLMVRQAHHERRVEGLASVCAPRPRYLRNTKYATTPVSRNKTANAIPLVGADTNTYTHNASATSAGIGYSHITNGCGTSAR